MQLSQGFDLCLQCTAPPPPKEIPQLLGTASPHVFIFPIQCSIFQKLYRSVLKEAFELYKGFHFIPFLPPMKVIYWDIPITVFAPGKQGITSVI